MIYLVRWLYAGLLYLYPRSFRAEFGDEMQQVFAHVLADAAPGSPMALLAICARELFGVLVGGLAARAHAVRVAIWGGALPPDTFSLEATLRRLLLVVGGLAGLGLVFTICLSIVLDVVVPQTATAPIERVTIGEVQLGGGGDYAIVPAPALRCTSMATAAGYPLDVCSTTFAGQPLQVVAPYKNSDGSILDPAACRASYGGTPVACEAGYTYGYGGVVTAIRIPALPGVSPARLAQLQQAQPLLYVQEDTWVALTTGLALVLATLALGVLWRWSRFQVAPLLARGGSRLLVARAGQVAVCLGSGVLLFRWMSWCLLLMVMGLGLVD
jgi:hypothetical protein